MIETLIAQGEPLARSIAGRVAARYRANGFTVSADEAYSGALEGLWKSAAKYRSDKGATFTTWAYPNAVRYATIAANEAAGLTASRGDGLVGVASLDALIDQWGAEADRKDDPEPADPYALDGDRVALGVAVRDAVAELPDVEREVVFLTYWQGLGPTDVGRRVGLSKTRVRQLLERAHVRLREQLDDEEVGQ